MMNKQTSSIFYPTIITHNFIFCNIYFIKNAKFFISGALFIEKAEFYKGVGDTYGVGGCGKGAWRSI